MAGALGRRRHRPSRQTPGAGRGRAHRRTRDHQQPVPEPRPSGRGRRPGRGRLRVRACRSPTSSPDPAATSSWRSGGTPECPVATAGWTSSGGSRRTGRLARTIDEVPDPVAARREPSLQLVGRSRADEVASEVDLAALQRRGRPADRSTGEPRRSHGAVRRRARGRHGGRRPAHARAPRLHRQVRRPRRPDPRGAGTCPPDGGHRRRRAVPARPARRSGSGRSCWPPATARTTTGSSCRSRSADGTFRQTRGVTDAPGVYVVGQRFQHRRDSGFIAGARHDAPADRAPPDGRRGADGRRPARRPAPERSSA